MLLSEASRNEPRAMPSRAGRPRRRPPALARLAGWLVGWLVLLPATPAAAQPPHAMFDPFAGPAYRLEIDNDIFVDSDGQFTSGIGFQRHSALSSDWARVNVPAWMKFGVWLPGLGEGGLHKRIGFAIGQNAQTPADITATELITDDVPYAGALAAELNWTAFDDDLFRGYALIVGLIGPASGAESVQKFIHDVTGSDPARGWHNQLPNELVVNFNGMFKKKLATFGTPHRWSIDVAGNADFGIGTGLVFGELSLEARAGFNVPRGFAFTPDPIGRTVAHNSALPNRAGGPTSVYFSLVARVAAMPYFIFFDGNLWQDAHGVDRELGLTTVITGLHLSRPSWSLHLSLWQSADRLTFEGIPDFDNDFGTLAFEWYLR